MAANELRTPEELPLEAEQRTSVPEAAPIPLVSPTPEPTPISLGRTSAVPVSDGVATKRAQRAHYGLGDKITKGIDDYHEAISRGLEPEIRGEVANEIHAKQLQDSYKSILEATKLANPEQSKTAVMDAVKNIPRVNANSVFEDFFASKYMDNLYSTAGYSYSPFSSQFSDDVSNNPTQVRRVTDIGKDLIAKTSYLEKVKDDLQERVKNQSPVSYGANIALDITTLGIYGEVNPRIGMGGPILAGLGTASEEIWKPVFPMEHDAFVKWVDDHVGPNSILGKENPQQALALLQAGLGRSTQDTTFDDLMTAGQVTSLLPLGTIRRAANATKSLVKSTEVLGTKTIAAANATAIGDLETAAVKDAAVSLVAHANNLHDVTKDALETLPSALQIHVVEEAAANPGNYGAEIKNRLQQYIDGIQEPLMNLLLEHQRVNQIPAITAAEDLMKIALEETKKRFPGLNSRILNMEYRSEPISNTHWADIIIGNNTGEYVKYESQMKGIAKLLNIDPKYISNDKAGLGWYIRYPVPIKLTDEGIRDLVVPIGERMDLMEQFINAGIGRARTPEETVSSIWALANRKIAQYGPSDFLQVFRAAMEPINNITPRWLHPTRTGKRWQEFSRLLEDGQTMRNPDDPLKQGYFFKSPAEMEYYYRRNFGRSPDIDEVMAYNAFKTVNEMDRMLRSIAVFRDKANYGVQRHQILSKTGNSPIFEGTQIGHWPGGTDNIALAWEDGYVKLVSTTDKNLAVQALVKKVEKGEGKIIELWNQYHRPLAGWNNIQDDQLIRYIYTEQGVKSDPLAWAEQVPRQGGGHLQTESPFYISQANVHFDPFSKKWHYTHDNTLAVARTSREGTITANHLDEARKLLEAGDKAAARKYLIDNQVPVNPDEFIDHFYPKKNTITGKIETRLGLQEPIRLRPANRMLGDIDNSIEFRYPKGMFKDGTKGGSMASNSSVQFTGERDVYELHEVRDIGTKANPYFDMQPAKFIDPISMMNRAGDRIINSLFMDDIKAYEVQRWLKNAEPYFKDGKDIWYYPWGIFNEPAGEFKAGMPKEIKFRLMDDWHKIRQFTGMTGEWAAFLDESAQKLANMVYDKAGPSASRLVPTWGVGRAIFSVPQKIRSFVFHPKLGMFNPAMFLVHAFTYVNTAAIAGPVLAGKGAFGSFLHFWSTLDKSPGVLDYLDRLATGVGYRPGEWKEARQMLLNSGMKNFEGEYALKDTPYAANIGVSKSTIKAGWDKFLDLGQAFFRGGARFVRVGSYYTAHQEFRHGGGGQFNWTGKAAEAINRNEADQILQRADLLAHNMGRASTSVLQKGMLSFGSQFAGYSYRILEMTTGKRLTPVERMRLFGTYMVFYGIPATFGIVGASDWIRKKLMEGYAPGPGAGGQLPDTHSYVVSQNAVESFLYEGMLATAMATFTGKGDPSKGTYYNMGDKYGSHDLGLMQKFLTTDATFLDIFGGAAHSQFKDMWESKNPVLHWMGNWTRGDYPYKLTWDDLVQPATTIASANALVRFGEAVHAGRNLSRRGEPLESNISTPAAFFRLATGLTSRQQADAWIKAQMIKNEKDNWHSVEKEVMMHLQRAFRARRDNDPDTALSEERNARAIAIRNGYPTYKMHTLFSRSLNANSDIIHRLNFDWVHKDVPKGEEIGRQQIWQQELQTEQQRLKQ